MVKWGFLVLTAVLSFGGGFILCAMMAAAARADMMQTLYANLKYWRDECERLKAQHTEHRRRISELEGEGL